MCNGLFRIDVTGTKCHHAAAMSTNNTEIIEMLASIAARMTAVEAKMDRILSGEVPPKPHKVRREETPPEKLDEARMACLIRTFRRYAGGSFAFKSKNRFPSSIVQPAGVTKPWEIVPWSILVNRCETQRIFWPAADGSEKGTARDIVERFVARAIRAGDIAKSTVGDLFPVTAGLRAGDVVILLSPVEKSRREALDEDEDDEVPAAKPWERGGTDSAPPKRDHPLRPWEDGYVAPPKVDLEDEDDELEDEENHEEIPPSVKKPAVEVEGFRKATPKKSWSIGGDDE